MNRTEKEAMVTMLSEVFATSQVGLLVDYRGLKVSEVTDLRRRLRENDAQMKVLKNRMAKIAIRETPFQSLEGELTETRAFVYGPDPVASAKAVTKYLSDNDKLKYISGVLVTPGGATVLDTVRVKELGDLPSREELLAKLMGVLNAVPAKFVRTLNEIPAKFVRTLAAVQQSKEQAG